MKRQQIDFDFSKWGQEGISVILPSRNHAVTLHKSPLGDNSYYGISNDTYTFHVNVNNLKMYEEIKPREIWVNEYSTGFGIMHFTEKDAIQQRDKARTFVKLVKFREVLDDEQ